MSLIGFRRVLAFRSTKESSDKVAVLYMSSVVFWGSGVGKILSGVWKIKTIFIIMLKHFLHSVDK